MNYWIWFSQVNGLGPVQKKILLDKFGTPEEIFKTKIERIEKIERNSESCYRRVKKQ
ncbi:MAG: hypothetical protein IJ217_05390 [Clostridia bacterium]|nr:hypothetical protein [Clostridia bacterium]